MRVGEHKTTFSSKSNKNTLSNRYSVNKDESSLDESKNILDMVNEEDSSYRSIRVNPKVSDASLLNSQRSLKASHKTLGGFCTYETLAKLVVLFDLLIFTLYLTFFIVYLYCRFNYSTKNENDQRRILQIGYIVLKVFFGFSSEFIDNDREND